MPPKKAEEDTVSMSQVRELLQQQKEFFLEMLQQQERTFKSFVEMIIDTSNKRCDETIKELYELKTSVHFTQKEVDDVKRELSTLSMESKSARGDILSLSESLLPITLKSDYLEGQSRRNNLVFDGIEESPDEGWAESEEKVKALLVAKLQLPGDIELERAHRMAGRKDFTTGRPRPIMAKFLRFKDRSAVLERARKLKGTNIFINEDFTEAVRQKRRDLMPALKAARDRGEIAYIRYDKLITHPAKLRKDR